jgi:hypothetical protein
VRRGEELRKVGRYGVIEMRRKDKIEKRVRRLKLRIESTTYSDSRSHGYGKISRRRCDSTRHHT